MSDTDVPIRDAATVILVRDAARAPKVLMGQRGKAAAFMPRKFVFPGGAVDPGDGEVPLFAGVGERCASRLRQESETPPEALAGAAIREVFEETGLILGHPGAWEHPAPDWADFAGRGYLPDASALRFFFRAITPPGRPRRFDARFFLADASDLAGKPDHFADDLTELSHLRWVPLDEVRVLDLAFITQLVLGELTRHLPSLDPPRAVPLVTNDTLTGRITWLS